MQQTLPKITNLCKKNLAKNSSMILIENIVQEKFPSFSAETQKISIEVKDESVYTKTSLPAENGRSDLRR